MGELSVQTLPWNPKFCPLCVARDYFIPFSKYIGGLEASVYYFVGMLELVVFYQLLMKTRLEVH